MSLFKKFSARSSQSSELVIPQNLADWEISLQKLEALLAQNPEADIRPNRTEERGHRLRRWLKAASFDPDQAFKMIQQYNDWWLRIGLEHYADEDEFDETGTLFTCGRDLRGRPSVIVKPGAYHFVNREESQRNLRRNAFSMQRCVERMPTDVDDHAALIICDCRGLSRKNIDLHFTREVIPIFNDYFADRMEKMLVVNHHWVFGYFWTFIKNMLDPVTIAKIQFVDHDVKATLLKYFPSDHPYLQHLFSGAPVPKPMPYSCPWLEEVARRQASSAVISVSSLCDMEPPTLSATTLASEASVEAEQTPSFSISPNANADCEHELLQSHEPVVVQKDDREPERIVTTPPGNNFGWFPFTTCCAA